MSMRTSFEDDQFPSTPGKFKIERTHHLNHFQCALFNRQFNRFSSSTASILIWALVIIALTASFLSFQTSLHIGSTSSYFTASVNDLLRPSSSSAPLRQSSVAVDPG